MLGLIFGVVASIKASIISFCNACFTTVKAMILSNIFGTIA